MKEINNSDKKVLPNLIEILSSRRKKQLLLITFLIIFNGIAEIFTLSSIVPLLNVISNNNYEIENNLLFKIYSFLLYFIDIEKSILIISVFIVILICNSILRLFTIFLINYISALIGNEIGTLAYSNCLNQEYKYHYKTNSSNIISTIITKTNSTVDTIKSYLNIFTSLIILFSILITLLNINKEITSLTISAIAIFYFCIYFFIKKRLKRISKYRSDLIQVQTQILQEGLGFIKDIILNKCQIFFIDLFRYKDKNLRLIDAKSDFLASSPKYLLELIAILFLLSFSVIFTRNTQNNSLLIPLIGSIAFGMQRLLPITQQIYASYVIISTNRSSVKSTLNLIRQKSISIKPTKNKYKLKESIELKDISFRYNDDSKYILKNFNLKISKGERIAIVGKSGSGKSTLVDILMGLIKPTSGEILIDKKSLYNPKGEISLGEWYGSISHVPQTIYLSDSSVASNIAFGTTFKDINYKRLKKAIKEAQLFDFIKKCPLGIETKVGENGVQISGGQRQRIGIARAVYKDGDIILLDEATSSLDTETEKAIIQCIRNLDKKFTIIIISHKENTIDFCDRVIKI